MYNLIVFGCYALAKIGLGLIAFKDCSEDAALLDEVSTDCTSWIRLADLRRPCLVRATIVSCVGLWTLSQFCSRYSYTFEIIGLYRMMEAIRSIYLVVVLILKRFRSLMIALPALDFYAGLAVPLSRKGNSSRGCLNVFTFVKCSYCRAPVFPRFASLVVIASFTVCLCSPQDIQAARKDLTKRGFKFS